MNVTNWTTSWRDGLAFAALVSFYNPRLLDFSRLSASDPVGNMKQAFACAYVRVPRSNLHVRESDAYRFVWVCREKLGVPSLLDPEDMLIPVPDKLSVITYVSQYV